MRYPPSAVVFFSYIFRFAFYSSVDTPVDPPVRPQPTGSCRKQLIRERGRWEDCFALRGTVVSMESGEQGRRRRRVFFWLAHPSRCAATAPNDERTPRVRWSVAQSLSLNPRLR